MYTLKGQSIPRSKYSLYSLKMLSPSYIRTCQLSLIEWMIYLFIVARAIFFKLSGGSVSRWQSCKFRRTLTTHGFYQRIFFYCDTWPQFTRSHLKDLHPCSTVGFEPTTQGSLDICATALAIAPRGRLRVSEWMNKNISILTTEVNKWSKQTSKFLDEFYSWIPLSACLPESVISIIRADNAMF